MQTIYRKVKYYGHCATICPIDQGILLAYYGGPECMDEQSVHIEYWIKGRLMSEMILPDKTGNCVLVPTSRDTATIIFSYFEDTDGTDKRTTPVTRWRFCSNWTMELNISRHKWIEHTDIRRFQALPSIGALVRCSPIRYGNKILLPAYKEHNCYGIILELSKGKWDYLSAIGFGKGILIQPTIWSDKDKVLHSLSRDITGNRKAWYSKSTDQGRTWMNPVPTEIDNHNNSIVVIDGTNLVIWNKGSDRSNLQLGRLSDDYQSAEPILKLNASGGGSYPNYCICDDRIEIVHTEMKTSSITRHIIPMEELNCLPDALPKNFLVRSEHDQYVRVPEPESWRSNEAL
jgi:hypothetical protein